MHQHTINTILLYGKKQQELEAITRADRPEADQVFEQAQQGRDELINP
jgi:hypothetical protein